MARHQREKVIQNEVHQNQCLWELYLRELCTQKFYREYHVNPLNLGEDCGATETHQMH
uniref:Uncharacterized protein n=1 Tax=Sciurus vulgaris TaxID=55149 RepID=A0A8D2D7X3_SCIVU